MNDNSASHTIRTDKVMRSFG